MSISLIDRGCMQTTIINSRVAQLKDGSTTMSKAAWSFTSGVGGGIFEVNSLVNFDTRFFKPNTVAEINSIYIRALISSDIRTHLIVGLPTIKR